MRLFFDRALRFVHSSDGPTAVEYAILISLVLLTCIAAVQSMGSVVTAPLQTVNSTLDGSAGSVTTKRVKPKRIKRPEQVAPSARR